ncbi:MAG TPA: thiamine pyrophosphate-dependent enzyme, partial [Euzebyales bacterium]|nr:thiamine pyrophosphate-dependent enzyme [Euzebyales bacterium]
EPVLIDGNNVEVVHEVIGAAIARARGGEGPALIEAETYRHGGHSRADPGKYRPQEEVDSWLARDPIPAYREQLLGDGVDGEVLDGISSEALAEIDDAATRAEASPPPDPAVIMTDVWADGGAAWRN